MLEYIYLLFGLRHTASYLVSKSLVILHDICQPGALAMNFFFFFHVAFVNHAPMFMNLFFFYQHVCFFFLLPQDFEVVRLLRKEELAGGGHIHVLDEAALCSPRRYNFPFPINAEKTIQPALGAAG